MNDLWQITARTITRDPGLGQISPIVIIITPLQLYAVFVCLFKWYVIVENDVAVYFLPAELRYSEVWLLDTLLEFVNFDKQCNTADIMILWRVPVYSCVMNVLVYTDMFPNRIHIQYFWIFRFQWHLNCHFNLNS